MEKIGVCKRLNFLLKLCFFLAMKKYKLHVDFLIILIFPFNKSISNPINILRCLNRQSCASKLH